MRVLNKIVEGFLGVTLVFTLILTFLNVFMRQFGFGLAWSEELIRYLIIWITFLGLSVCVREGSHISIDAIPELFKGKYKKVFSCFVYIICLMFSVILIWYAYAFIIDQSNSSQVTPALGVPMYYFYVIILISGILITLEYVFLLVKTFKEFFNNEQNL